MRPNAAHASSLRAACAGFRVAPWGVAARTAHRAPRTAPPAHPHARDTAHTHKTHKRIRATVVSALEAQLERLDVLLGGGGAVSVYLLFAPFPPNKRRTLQLPHIL